MPLCFASILSLVRGLKNRMALESLKYSSKKEFVFQWSIYIFIKKAWKLNLFENSVSEKSPRFKYKQSIMALFIFCYFSIKKNIQTQSTLQRFTVVVLCSFSVWIVQTGKTLWLTIFIKNLNFKCEFINNNKKLTEIDFFYFRMMHL